MVELIVKDGIIHTKMGNENPDYPLAEEVKQGIGVLLALFQAEAIHQGNPQQVVKSVFCEIMSDVLVNNDNLVLEKLDELSNPMFKN